MSKREQIRMTDEEVSAYLRRAQTIILNSISPSGVPHPMPMWFAIEDDGTLLMTSFARSQKVKNLERDPRVSLLVEDGQYYDKLRGVVIYGTAKLVRDPEQVLAAIDKIPLQSPTPHGPDPVVRAGLLRTANKRVLIRVKPERVVSWDHSKLGGVY